MAITYTYEKPAPATKRLTKLTPGQVVLYMSDPYLVIRDNGQNKLVAMNGHVQAGDHSDDAFTPVDSELVIRT